MKKDLRILYFGASDRGTTSYHRANALARLGHRVIQFDPYDSLGSWNRRYVRSINYRLGYSLSQSNTCAWLVQELEQLGDTFDLAWIDGGEFFGPNCLRIIRRHAKHLVLFNHDDPSGSRDKRKFRTLRQSIREYDLCAVVRPFNVPEFFNLGAKDVVQVWRGYDEIAHAPSTAFQEVPEAFRSDIAFIGWRQEAEHRDRFLLQLVEAGLRPAIWGGNWQTSPLWSRLRPYWRGGYLAGEDYVNAIRGAKICLGLLAKANRDEHTTRSMEIPYAGGLLCAERTEEHMMLYKEGEEAVFWSTSEECISECKRLLQDEGLRLRICEAGRKRVIANRVGNEDLCSHILNHLYAGKDGYLVKKPGLPVPPPKRKVAFFDSHPVQYKAPVYQELQKLLPDSFEVIYATDASVKSDTLDEEFGVKFAWDVPLLEGYKFRVLDNSRGVPLSGPGSLTGRGVFRLLLRDRPRAVVFVQSRYLFDLAAFISALLLRIPMLLRQETQDEMYGKQRTRVKSIVRSMAYRIYYRPIGHAFAFGKLNLQHLKRHGFRDEEISMARFSVPDPLRALSAPDKERRRKEIRRDLGIPESNLVVSFFGKFIPKKNPELLIQSVEHLSPSLRERLTLLYVGSGELLGELERQAADIQHRFSVECKFTGFVNQASLPAYYLASDIVVLPSRPMGEAWGLVVNEGLQAGCAVILSTAVGCVPEFDCLERVRVIKPEDAQSLGNAIEELSGFPRAFDWATEYMQGYSTESAARAIAAVIRRY